MVARTNKATIQVVPDSQTKRLERYIRDDSVFGDVRFHYIQGAENRHIQLYKQNVFETYSHSREVVEEIVDSFEGHVGLEIPSDFLRKTSIYILKDMLRFDGVTVPFRIENTSIFLGANVFAPDEHSTWNILYHALGNALWNFMDVSIWYKNHGWDGSLDKKNKYRELRGISIAQHENVAKENGYVLPFQRKSLFYIAAEDFRVLFGPASMVSKRWELDSSDYPIAPPTPEVADFWSRELIAYGEGSK